MKRSAKSPGSGILWVQPHPAGQLAPLTSAVDAGPQDRGHGRGWVGGRALLPAGALEDVGQTQLPVCSSEPLGGWTQAREGWGGANQLWGKRWVEGGRKGEARAEGEEGWGGEGP